MAIDTDMRLFLTAAAVTLAVASTQAFAGAVKPPEQPQSQSRGDAQARHQAMAGVKSWAIQLRFIDRAKVIASATDLIVIDHAAHPDVMRDNPFSAEEIAPLKLQPGGKRRLVLAYLSIGEAEIGRAHV
jgi:endo-alpha-1,4-polygalactosaminidase (GH114 family)